MSEHGTNGPTEDHPPIETPESRMTGEGSPPPDEEQEKTGADGPEYAVTDGTGDDRDRDGHGSR